MVMKIFLKWSIVNAINATHWNNGKSDGDVINALNPYSDGESENDDFANWCNEQVIYGSGDYGSPGTANNGCGSTVVDADGDGFDSSVDCDDNSAQTFPGAAESESSTACMKDDDTRKKICKHTH